MKWFISYPLIFTLKSMNVSKRYRPENGPEIFRVNYISFAFFIFYDFYNLDVRTSEMCLKIDCSVETPRHKPSMMAITRTFTVNFTSCTFIYNGVGVDIWRKSSWNFLVYILIVFGKWFELIETIRINEKRLRQVNKRIRIITYLNIGDMLAGLHCAFISPVHNFALTSMSFS